jgi:uncharacterized protein YycO
MGLLEKFLTILGDIKVFKWPFFLIYQPKGYLVKGIQTEQILSVIKEGDILLRGYNDYLDGKFIPSKFSHAGFYYGNNTVIHAIAEGCVQEHLIDFCRCDRIAVIRIMGLDRKEIKLAKEKAMAFLGVRYDFDFKLKNNKLYCSELVAKIWSHAITINPVNKKMFGLFNRKLILPDQFHDHQKAYIVFKHS